MGLFETASAAVKDTMNRSGSRIVTVDVLLPELEKRYDSLSRDQITDAILRAIALHGGAAEFAGNADSHESTAV
ncbi:hypothetical protein [Aestuariivirga sp.]|uniref:hypothetical protein n=1 Tax=Aestuariivirga sp. TaxID=2650926 RepID=UPI00391A51B9